MPSTTVRSKIVLLRQELAALRQKMAALEHEKADLELLLETNVAHSDIVAEELWHDLEATKETLLAEIGKLRREVTALHQEKSGIEQEKADLELLMETNVELSDIVEEELWHDLDVTKQTLLAEIARLRHEIEILSQKVTELQHEKADLEVLIELNIEHADFVEENLLAKVESTLRESERRFRLISETIPIPIIVNQVTDKAIVYANKPASALLGLPIEDLLKRKVFDFFDLANQPPLLNALSVQGYVSHYELQVQRGDGTLRWAALSAQVLTFNNAPCLLNVLYDLTDRKIAEEKIRSLNEELEHRVKERTAELQAANLALQKSFETLKITQDQLIQAEKAVALTGLVAGIAHEMNTPVGICLTSASYLEQQTYDLKTLYDEEKMKRSDLENYLQDALKSTSIILRNLSRAVSQIRVFKQVAVDHTSDEKRRFHLKAYIDDLLVSLRPKFELIQPNITVHCPEEIEIVSYPGAFSQIITNFVMNSLIHGFDLTRQGEIVLDITNTQGILQIQYRDNGKGIPQEQRSRIFDAFYTTKRGQGGTGLGLYIVYNLVTQQLKGEITCQSTPGAGTAFSIQIPLEQG